MVAVIKEVILASAFAAVVASDPTYYSFSDTSNKDSAATWQCRNPDPTNSLCLDTDLTTAESYAIFTSKAVTRDWTVPNSGDFVYARNGEDVDPTTVCDGSQYCYNHPNVIQNGVAQIQAPADVYVSSIHSAQNCLTQWMLGADPSNNTFSSVYEPKGVHSTSMQKCQMLCIEDLYCDFWSFDASVDITTDGDINCYLQTSDAEEVAMSTKLNDPRCGFAHKINELSKAAVCSDGVTAMCAVASGKYISGKKYCSVIGTPSLEYLQTGIVCASGFPPFSGASSTIIRTAIAGIIVAVLVFL